MEYSLSNSSDSEESSDRRASDANSIKMRFLSIGSDDSMEWSDSCYSESVSSSTSASSSSVLDESKDEDRNISKQAESTESSLGAGDRACMSMASSAIYNSHDSSDLNFSFSEESYSLSGSLDSSSDA